MTKVGEKYKCQVCTNIVSVEQEGVGILVCCDKPMVSGEEESETKEELEKISSEVAEAPAEEPLEEKQEQTG